MHLHVCLTGEIYLLQKAAGLAWTQSTGGIQSTFFTAQASVV